MTATAPHGTGTRPGEEPPEGCPAGAIMASPPIGGGNAFARTDGPCALRIAIPLTAEMIIAALYGDPGTGDPGACDDQDIWLHIGVAIAQDGTTATGERARRIREDEDDGALDDPARLAACRSRVAALIGPHWQAAPYRCPAATPPQAPATSPTISIRPCPGRTGTAPSPAGRPWPGSGSATPPPPAPGRS